MRFKIPTILAIFLIAGFFISAPVDGQTKGSSGSGRSGSSTQSAKTEAEFNALVKQADDARTAGHLGDAVPLYVKALKIHPNWPDGWWYVGTILYDADNYTDARDAFHNLVTLDPKHGTAWAMLGLCEFQTREYEPSAIALTRARDLGLEGNQQLASVVRYHAALVYIRFEQYEVAFDVLREFLREGNENPKIIEAFGLAMLRMPYLPSEIPPDKRDQILLAGRGGYYMAAHRLDESRQSLQDLVSRYPNEPNVHYSYGVFLLNQDADAALKEFQRELDLSPNHVPSMLQMAFEYYKRNEYEKALPLAEKSAQLSPKMYQARNILGRVLLEMGQTDRAIKELEEGVRLQPASPEMHFALAKAYTRAGRKQDADRERELFKQLENQGAQQNAPANNGAADKPAGPPKPKP